MFNYLPQGHDKNLKQAFYNTAATVFVVLVFCAALAVYYILEAFLRPLLWAVLCGTVLHPFKTKLTTVVQRWLRNLRKGGTPLIVGTVFMPFQVIDTLSEKLSTAVFTNAKLILTVSAGLPTVYMLYYFGPLLQIFIFIKTVFVLVYEIVGYFHALWVS